MIHSLVVLLRIAEISKGGLCNCFVVLASVQHANCRQECTDMHLHAYCDLGKKYNH